MTKSTEDNATPQNDPDCDRLVREEEACLTRVLNHVAARAQEPAEVKANYDVELLALRDEIATARQEDLAPLVEEMTRMQALAARRGQAAQGTVDARSPYFGHLVLQENKKEREVLIGRSTYLDTKAGVRIVDWRDAPVSRIYYRYDEGDDYEESFGAREVLGVVKTRRAVTITNSVLRRIVAPQGSFVRGKSGWRKLDAQSARLKGGEGAAPRPERQKGRLGIGEEGESSDDKRLREITPLIDPRQFELITRPDSGVVVIQGGAGSGKTTVGLHRMAYLAFHDKHRFSPDRMMVIVFNDALARYMSQLLPELGVGGVAIRTYEDWAGRLRGQHLPHLPQAYNEFTPGEVTKVKKHPVMLQMIDSYVATLADRLEGEIVSALQRGGAEDRTAAFVQHWREGKNKPLYHRVMALKAAVERQLLEDLPTNARVGLERVIRDGSTLSRDILSAWADLLTDLPRLKQSFAEWGDGKLSTDELKRAHEWCVLHCPAVVTFQEEALEDEAAAEEAEPEPKNTKKSKSSKEEDSNEDESSEDDRSQGIDGRAVEDHVTLDREDDALLLRLGQRLRGPLRKHLRSKEAIIYEHVFIDETQDLSPVELAVVLDCVSPAKCVTFAGDVAQRLLLDNGFSNWKDVLGQLGLNHVEVEPLKLSYRSTHQIIDLAQHVLGDLAPTDPPVATRDGAPVELFCFSHTGDAASFLAEALRELLVEEPRASVAVIARYPEHADAYFHALKQAEIPLVRRIADQDFPFKPGVDVTDVRQVKGLEFDYVVVVEASEAGYPTDDESRHLLHIAATRAAHQLWLLSSGRPSLLLPSALTEDAF
ncbi:MAG: 3'-5' exonuclease [Polyangiaceae bacterium]|nr:3'-5' exonuclease [Polyangiaceae bacterium]